MPNCLPTDQTYSCFGPSSFSSIGIYTRLHLYKTYCSYCINACWLPITGTMFFKPKFRVILYKWHSDKFTLLQWYHLAVWLGCSTVYSYYNAVISTCTSSKVHCNNVISLICTVVGICYHLSTCWLIIKLWYQSNACQCQVWNVFTIAY